MAEQTSARITRLPRYNEPLRHPRRPACPSRASGWSSLTTHWGFPCCARSPCVVESTTGAVAADLGEWRLTGIAGASVHGQAPFPVAARRTGRVDLPHPALGQDFTLSPTEGRACQRLTFLTPAVPKRCSSGNRAVPRPASCASCATTAQPLTSRAHRSAVRFADRPETEVVGPTG